MKRKRKNKRHLFSVGEVLGAIVRQKVEITYNTKRMYPNGKKAPDGIEIRFGNTKPIEEVREMLKSHGYRFSEKQKIWYAVVTEKSKELAETLEKIEVDVDDAEYEKITFWAKVKSLKEFYALRDFTDFMVQGTAPKFFYNKKNLLKAYPSLPPLIDKGLLSYKKFYNKLVGKEDNAEEEEPTKEKKSSSIDLKVAENLQAKADAMQKQIDAKLNSATQRQRPTAKRLRVAAGMREDGYRLQEIQSLLYALSNAHRKGTIKEYPYLTKIRTIADIQLINQYGNALKYKWGQDSIQQSFVRNKIALDKFGINSVHDWSIAHVQIGELLQTQTPSAVRKESDNERKIKELEQKIFGSKIAGFFPTPKPLIERMLELAELELSDSILEPEAGKGDILDAIKEHLGNEDLDLNAVEQNYSLREILELKGYNLVGTDFLSYQPTKKYDKIVMNPPFENGQDAEHVTHALELLNKKGRVVAIMGEGVFFRQFKKDAAFRDLLKEYNAYISEPIKEAFKNGFNATGVNVRIVVMNKDKSPLIKNTNKPKKMNADEDSGEDLERLELEAEAELELLKMRVENEKKRKGLNGLEGIDEDKLNRFRQRAFVLSGNIDVLDFK